MKLLFWLPMVLTATVSHAACRQPQPPYIPDPAAATEIFAGSHQAVLTYVRDLDCLMSCIRGEAAGLKPLEAKAAHDDYARALVLMRQAVQAYDQALAAHEAGS